MKTSHALLVALVGALVYANTLGAGFALDDKSVVLGNEAIRGWDGVRHVFGEDYLARTPVAADPSLYRPAATLSFALDHALHGLRPFGYHLGNVLLHAIACVLALGVARIFAGPRVALAGALLFAVHPVHVEAVANVAGRPELLAGIGIFGTLSAWDRFRRAEQTRSALWAACLGAFAFALAVFSKESGVVALPLIAALELARPERRALDRRAFLLAAALTAIAGVFLVLRAAAIGPAPTGVALGAFPWGRRVATAVRVLVEQVGQLLVPVELRAIWTEAEVPVEARLVTWASVAGAAAIAVALALAWRARRRAPAFAFGVAFFALAVLPTANILFPIGTVRAERLLYTPSFGICLAFAAVLDRVVTRTRVERAFAFVVGALVLACAARTWVRNPDWRDDRALAEATLAASPDAALPWGLLADWHAARGELAPAADALRRFLALQPTADAWALLGDLERRQARTAGAREAWERALALDPERADVLQNLSTLHLSEGRARDALPLLERLCALEPDLVAAQGNRIAALLATGDRARAATLAREVAQRFPADPKIQAIAREALRGR